MVASRRISARSSRVSLGIDLRIRGASGVSPEHWRSRVCFRSGARAQRSQRRPGRHPRRATAADSDAGHSRTRSPYASTSCQDHRAATTPRRGARSRLRQAGQMLSHEHQGATAREALRPLPSATPPAARTTRSPMPTPIQAGPTQNQPHPSERRTNRGTTFMQPPASLNED